MAKKRIVVAGGGFGGIYGATAAAKLRGDLGKTDDLEILLVSNRRQLVLRPRLYEAHPERMVQELSRTLDPVGVGFTQGDVTGIDADSHTITVRPVDRRDPEAIPYDKLIVATGSHLVGGTLAGGGTLHNVDSLPGALALDAHLHALGRSTSTQGRHTAVVVGSGFTGLEIACSLVSRLRQLADAEEALAPAQVVLVERSPVVAPRLGDRPRPAIQDALAMLGVDVRLGTEVTGFDGRHAWLADGTEIPAQTLVWTTGMRASELTAFIRGNQDPLGRLIVDEEMRVGGEPDIFPTADCAAAPVDEGQTSLQSCQYADQLGRVSGYNAVADLYGVDSRQLDPWPYVTCLDLGAAGGIYTAGFDRSVRLTGQDALVLKRQINGEGIYPEVDNPSRILARATVGAAPKAEASLQAMA